MGKEWTLAENDAQGEWALPDGWVWTTIGEITQPIEKVKPGENPDASFTYLEISSIDNQSNRIAEPKVYYGAEAPSRARQLVQANDVLFSTVRTYLKNIALVPEAYDGQIASTGFSVLRSEPGVSSKYLFYYALTDPFLNKLGKLQRGTSYPAVRDGDVRAQLVPLAPLPEQRRIVAEIETQCTRLDAAVAALERAQANIRRYKAAVLQAACEGRLVPTEAELVHAEGRDYEPADQLLARILAERHARWEATQWEREIEKAKQKAAKAARKAAGLPARIRDLTDEEWQDLPEEIYAQYLPKDDRWKQKYKEPAPSDVENLPELPEGWVWATVEQISEMTQYGTSEKADLDPSGIPVLRMGNIQDGELDFSNLKYFPLDWPKLDDFLLQDGDVLFNRTNSAELVGKTAVYKRFHPRAAFASYLIRVRTHSDYVPDLLTFYINSFYGRRYIASVVSQQVGQANVSGTKLSRMPVVVPPIAEQRRIVAEVDRRLSLIAALEASVEAALVRAGRLRQAVLKRAFEGRLLPQDPDDEPASVLLERIRAEREGKRERKQARQMRLPGT